MGLKQKFDAQESNLTVYGKGKNPSQPNHEGATAQSKLHAFDNLPGYSLNGDFASIVQKYDAAYDNGGAILLPKHSRLDLNGKTPKGYQSPEVGIDPNNLLDTTN